MQKISFVQEVYIVRLKLAQSTHLQNEGLCRRIYVDTLRRTLYTTHAIFLKSCNTYGLRMMEGHMVRIHLVRQCMDTRRLMCQVDSYIHVIWFLNLRHMDYHILTTRSSSPSCSYHLDRFQFP